MLIESIRAFTGQHRDADIFAVAPRPNLGVDKEHGRGLRLSMSFTTRHPLIGLPEYGSANRVYAAAWAAENSSATTLIVLDSDTLFLDEPELLGADFDVAVRPVRIKGSATTVPED